MWGLDIQHSRFRFSGKGDPLLPSRALERAVALAESGFQGKLTIDSVCGARATKKPNEQRTKRER